MRIIETMIRRKACQGCERGIRDYNKSGLCQACLTKAQTNARKKREEDKKMEEIPKYSEVKKELQPAFPGIERVDLASVLNKEIIVYEFKAYPSSLTQGKEFVVCLADLNGRRVSFNCGEIVLKQLKDIADKLPIRTVITREKGKRYYTLS